MHVLLLVLVGVLLVGARSPSAATPLERAVLAEFNRVRAQPLAMRQSLEVYRDLFVGDVAHEEPGDLGRRTVEGRAAVDDALHFVNQRAPVQPLLWDEGLARAALDRAEDQQVNGGFGHIGSDGSTMGARISRYASGKTLIAEIISYGPVTAAGVVRQLVVSDGERARLHRADVFEPTLRHVGVGCRAHPVFGWSCVIDLSAN